MSAFSRVVEVDTTGSTNADLVALADSDPDEWPHLSVLVAHHQSAGRGRSGRTWVVAPGSALTASVVLRVDLPPVRTTWVPLVVALALKRALTDLGAPATTKWPNDVVLLGAGTEAVDGWGRARKVAGILVEVSPRTRALVVGVGVDVRAGSSPVEWSSNLEEIGLDVGPRDVLDALGRHLPGLVDRLVAAEGDAEGSGIADEIVDGSITIGKRVRVELPDGATVVGTAVRLDPTGGLVVQEDDGAERLLVTGDVTHMRFDASVAAEPAGDGTAGDGTVVGPLAAG
ncbi:MAG: biotin--[acetyl-CoA-carboxylase] ligase [Actinomycetaceae bacterium]